MAIKQLKKAGMEGTHEFVVECLMLLLLHHPNLVNLIGYCAEGDQRILVYEHMSQGSLENHLFGWFLLLTLLAFSHITVLSLIFGALWYNSQYPIPPLGRDNKLVH